MKGWRPALTGARAAAAVVLALVAGVLASSQVSAQEQAARISRATVVPGGQGSVDLDARNITAPGLASWTIDVTYDPEVVTPVACHPELGGVCNTAFGTATVRVAGARGAGLQGDTKLASITFRCESTGASALMLRLRVFSDATPGDPQTIDAVAENGSLACVPTSGDVDCDGGVNVIDAALLLQYDAGLSDPLPCQGVADVNGDGAINTIDAVLILQFDVGLVG